MENAFEFVDLRTVLVTSQGDGGDCGRQKQGHWLFDTLISNPMSGYADHMASRTSRGLGVLGSFVVGIETAG